MDENKKKTSYTLEEAGQILEVSKPTLSKVLQKKEFKWVRLDDGEYRISKKSFDDWLDKGPVR